MRVLVRVYVRDLHPGLLQMTDLCRCLPLDMRGFDAAKVQIADELS